MIERYAKGGPVIVVVKYCRELADFKASKLLVQGKDRKRDAVGAGEISRS